MNIEYTDDPHPRNTYWEMWGHPMFDNPDAAAVIYELNECRKAYGDRYIRVSAFDATARLGVGPPLLHRQPPEGGARLPPRAPGDRRPRASATPSRAYATDRPEGQRYA